MAVSPIEEKLRKEAEDVSTATRFADVLKFLSSAKGDLANVTAPTFFLAPSSVVENASPWAQRPAIFTAPAVEQDPARRSLMVMRMFLISLRQQLYVGGTPNVSIKKPLNAFLGELFLSSWTDSKTGATTRLIIEQVSHHPPITAVHVSSPEYGIRADGYSRVEMTYSGSINIRQVGHAIMHVDRFNEDYLIPLPAISVRGFLSACLYPEMSGTYKIVSNTGLVSEINFSGKGIFKGKKRNAFEGRVYHEDDTSEALYEVEGVWSDGWEIRDARIGEVIETYDVEAPENQPEPSNNENIEDMDPWESRRAWSKVTDALQKGDFTTASTEKTKVEEAQRQMRMDEKQTGQAWEPLFFESVPGEQHEVFHRLTERTGEALRDSDTKGVWRLKDDMLGRIQKPFRGDLTPLGKQ